MKRRLAIFLTAATASGALAGCGSLYGLAYSFSHYADMPSTPVYLGTRTDAKLLGQICTGELYDGGPNPLLSVILFPIVLGDLTLSAVADALLLPLTVTMEIFRPHWHRDPHGRR